MLENKLAFAKLTEKFAQSINRVDVSEWKDLINLLEIAMKNSKSENELKRIVVRTALMAVVFTTVSAVAGPVVGAAVAACTGRGTGA